MTRILVWIGTVLLYRDNVQAATAARRGVVLPESLDAIGLAKDLGSIEVGKLADLQVLDRNPLVDIRNTNSIRYVMKNGRLYDGNTLDEIWPRALPLPRQWWWEEDPPRR